MKHAVFPPFCRSNQAVAYFLAKDMQPVYTVEKSGFKFLVSKLNPRYSLPSRKYFTEVE